MLQVTSLTSFSGRRRRFIPIRFQLIISRIVYCLLMAHYAELITHLHHAFLASGAPKSFFATEIPTPSKGEHIHHSSSVGGSPCTCFLVNGSQCSHPYLWTRCIPMIGTNTRKNPMTPRHHGVCITDLTRS